MSVDDGRALLACMFGDHGVPVGSRVEAPSAAHRGGAYGQMACLPGFAAL
jgi:hypothetical protein